MGLGLVVTRVDHVLDYWWSTPRVARAPMREGAHNWKQVLRTLFAGGYECPYEDRELECRRSGRKLYSWWKEF